MEYGTNWLIQEYLGSFRHRDLVYTSAMAQGHGNAFHTDETEIAVSDASTRALVRTCFAIAVAVAIVAAIGIFARGDGMTRSLMSPRNEEYTMVTDGVYRYNTARLVSEGIGWDIVTLIVVVPAFFAGLPALARGSVRGSLFSLGILTYLAYQYLMYAVTWAFGPLFLPFVLIYSGSLVGVIWIIGRIDISTLPSRFGSAFPARGIAVFSITMALLLIFMWLGRIIPAARREIDGILLGQNTLTVQALDLGIIVPLALATGISAWRRSDLSFLLGPLFMVQGGAMAAAILAMLGAARVREGTLESAPMVVFGTAFVSAIWLGTISLRSIQETTTGNDTI